MKRLDCIWRLFGTGFSFLIFGMAGLIMGILVGPILLVLVRNPDSRQRAARRLIGSAFRAFIWMMKSLGVISYQIKGMENSKASHNQLVIANHPTLIDVVFLISLFPLVDCVVKEAVIKSPFMRGLVVPAMYISGDDPGKLLDTCVTRLKSGASLLLFPEGTRSVYGHPLEFRPGAASIAARSKVNILPVTIQCTQPRFLAKHEPWYRVPPEQPFFLIRILQPLSLQELIPAGLNTRNATHSLNRFLLRHFEQEIG